MGMALGGGLRARSSSTTGGRVGESRGGISDFNRFDVLFGGTNFALLFSWSFFAGLSRSSSSPRWIGDSRSGIGGFDALMVREWPVGFGPFRGVLPAGFFRGLGSSSPMSMWKGGDRSGGIFGLGISPLSTFRGVEVKLSARDRPPLTIIVDLGEGRSFSFSLAACSRPIAAPEGVAAFGSLASICSLGAALSFGASRLRCVLDLEAPAGSSLDAPSPVLDFFGGVLLSSESGGRFRVSCIGACLASLSDCNAVLRCDQCQTPGSRSPLTPEEALTHTCQCPALDASFLAW